MKNIFKTKNFTVSIADEKNVVSADYVGIVSGNKEPDKIEKAVKQAEYKAWNTELSVIKRFDIV